MEKNQKLKEKIFINKDKKYLKGNLHTHTTKSDGKHTLQEVVDIYRKANYDFLGITDHEKFGNEELDSDIVLLNGVEETCLYVGKENQKGAYTHFNCFVKKENVIDKVYKYKKVSELQKAINDINKKYSITQWNHPLQSRLLDTEAIKLEGYNLVEVYNHKDYLEEYGEINAEHLVRVLLNHGKRLYVTAGDDFHGPYNGAINEKCFGGYINVNAEKNKESIFDAISRGDFYATTGPQIFDYRMNGAKLKIETSPVQKIIFCTNLRKCKNIYSVNGEDITYGEYEIAGNESYVWVKVVDKNGNTAWTQPVFMK